MALQNRVDPAGTVHAVEARGFFTGNRGLIHDPASRSLLKRRWTTKAWIICDCDFKGRQRDVFGRNGGVGGAGWTNLFFLDEVTALAAGHRPCFECRREAAKNFAECFSAAFGRSLKAPEIDEVLHAERLASRGPLIELAGNVITALPDGAMVSLDGRFFARRGGALHEWGFVGYAPPINIALSDSRLFRQITPASTILALKAGYQPVWDASVR